MQLSRWQGTLPAAWADFESKVDWSDVNRAGNVLRVQKYLAPWKQWTAPIGKVRPLDAAELLGPIRIATPSQYRKLVGLLNRTFVQAAGLEWIEQTPMVLAQKLLANTGKVRAAMHHPVLLEWEPLRELVKSIRNAAREPFSAQCTVPSMPDRATYRRSPWRPLGRIPGPRWRHANVDDPALANEDR